MPNPLPIHGEYFAVANHEAFLIHPPLPPSTTPPAPTITPWIWYAPSLPGTPGPEEKWMFERFLAQGIAIAGIDIGEAYGSPGGRAGFTALYEYLTERRSLAKKPCLLARSRGGLMLYNWAAENPTRVTAIAGIYPVCNLTSYPGLAKACSAYNLTEAQLAATLSDHNPIDRLAPLAAAKIPIFHIHGDIDTLVPYDQNTGPVVDRYRALGGEITVEIPKGQGHNYWPGFFQCEALTNFLITHATGAKGR